MAKNFLEAWPVPCPECGFELDPYATQICPRCQRTFMERAQFRKVKYWTPDTVKNIFRLMIPLTIVMVMWNFIRSPYLGRTTLMVGIFTVCGAWIFFYVIVRPPETNPHLSNLGVSPPPTAPNQSEDQTETSTGNSCSQCGTPNPMSAKFCSEYGRPLQFS